LRAEPPPDLPAQIVALFGDPIVIVATGPADGAAASIVYANAGFARLIGRNLEAISGQPLRALAAALADPSELARLIDAVERRRAIDLSSQIVAAGGRTLWTEIQGRPLEGEDRPYLVRLRDVTAHRTMLQSRHWDHGEES
jgi:PAS domain S-box-containing protein